MQVLPLFLATLAAFALAYKLYGGFLARRLGLDATRPTPAHEMEDGVDYCPTPRGYLLAQHFSAISAAGPIVGPILAGRAFGWGPALLWIVFGCIFIGALHDLTALFGSVRHAARTVPQIVREHMSRPAYGAFLAFVWLALVYVIVAFADITARAFVDRLPLENGDEVSGAGVASASALYLVIGVAMGCVMKFLKPRLWVAAALFVPLTGLAIWAGQAAPLHAPAWFGEDRDALARSWNYLILAYCAVASVTPMWALLQPRGFLGGFFLYGVLAFAFVGILVGGDRVEYPAFRGFSSPELGALFPFLFITIACGACSGFHGLVCSGTTSRQLDREPDARAVGYGGMLLEGVVAVISLICVMLVAEGDPRAGKDPNVLYALGVGGFVARFGIDPGFAVAFALLAFTTFVYDTLDVATRLGRYVLQELFGARSRLAGALATLATLALPAAFVGVTRRTASGAEIPSWRLFWGIFGASNQLLAALTLLGLTVWFARAGRRRAVWLTALPAAFMMTMTVWSLGESVRRAWTSPRGFTAPDVTAAVLLALAAFLTFEAVRALRRGAAGSQAVRS
ncbi:MAG TPA: carbon starvation CstA family protein [Planctomycetota bacterium]|nr:carbon starvation CstA family protein [Planctomycetota bacterium]